MRRLIYKAISERFFFPSSLICSYINIKCLSGNKLLHYTWYGYKISFSRQRKQRGFRGWQAGSCVAGRERWRCLREPWGHRWAQLCCPRPGRPSVSQGFADVPIKRLWKRLAARNWHLFCLCLGPALEIWAGKQCQKGLCPLAGSPRAMRPAESVTLTGRVCLLGRCYPVID